MVYVVVTVPRGHAHARERLEVFSVRASGSSVVAFPGSSWFELAGLPTIEQVAAALSEDDVIQEFHTVAEGAGSDLAKQVPLFARAGDGVRCGTKLTVLPDEQFDSDDSEQMPLFE